MSGGASKSLWHFPKIIGHRGCGTLAPENTLEAIQIGYSKYGYRAIEFDVMLTKDLVPILMHDHKIGRTIDLPNCKSWMFSSCRTKWISDLTWNEIKELDAGSWFSHSKSEDTAGYSFKVPLFEDVIKLCKEKGIWMNIEIKPVPGFETLTGQIVAEMVSKYFPPSAPSAVVPPSSSAEADGDSKIVPNNSENDSLLHHHSINPSIGVDNTPPPLFSSFSKEALMSAKEHAPHIPRGLLIKTLMLTPDWRNQLDDVEAVSLNLHYKFLSQSNYNEIRAYKHKSTGRQVAIFCFTVNDSKVGKELFDMGVDAFCTDKLDIFPYVPHLSS